MRAACELPEQDSRYTALIRPLLACIAPEAKWAGDTEEARCVRTIGTFWLLGALPWPLVFAFIYGVMFDCAIGFGICLASFVGFAPVPWMLRRVRRPIFCAHWLLVVMLGTLVALGCITGGPGAPALTWMLGVPLVAIHLTGPRGGAVWCGLTLSSLFGFQLAWHAEVDFPRLLAPGQLEFVTLAGNVGIIVLTSSLAAAYDAQRHDAILLARDRQLRLHEALERTEEHAVELARQSAALRESEAHYRCLVENSPMGMYFYELRGDADLVLTGANPAADRISGLDARPLLGLRLEEAFPDLADTELPGRFRAAAKDGIPWMSEQVAFDNGRSIDLFEVRAFQNSPGRVVAVFLNVTDRVQAEEAIRARERELALEAGKAEVATDVLHNVGNVLSRVKTLTTILTEKLRASELATLELVAQRVAEHLDDLPRFLTEDDSGRRLPAFFIRLAEVLKGEQEFYLSELRNLAEALDHVALIVSMQQVHNKVHGIVETVAPDDVVELAVTMCLGARRSQAIEIVRDYEELPPVPLYRHRVLQILMNLLNNARQAMLVQPEKPARLVLEVRRSRQLGVDGIAFSVRDNGAGIAPEHLDKLFTFGFTTRRDGHGFGLHSSANLAREMGGCLTASSDGPGRGSVFTLEVPLVLERVCP